MLACPRVDKDPIPATMVRPQKARAQLLNCVLSAIRRGRLLQPGDRVGACVSGGADSVALLRLLIELREELGVVLSVVHFNHQLRGKQSDADEKFVAKLAAKHGLPFHAGRENVGAKAKREKANLEDAGRRARYGFFARLVDEEKLTRLAVAHTADDQAETVLAHILRGTGLAGLGGIHPTSNHIIRPLLQIRRADLREYLKDRKQVWREDATNRDTSKMRARIRAKLLPLLQREFQPAVVEHLATLAELAREDEAYLDFTAQIRSKVLFERNAETASINTADLLGYPKRSTKPVPVEWQLKIRSGTRRLVRHIVNELKPGAGQLNADHVQSIVTLAEYGENGKSLPLPGGIEVRREHDKLIFGPKLVPERENKLAERSKKFEHPIEFSGSEAVIEVPCLACVFRFRIIDWPPNRRETSITGTVLDRHALGLPLVLRSWRAGDQFRPSGHRKAHKLKRLLNEKRISRWEREGWPVLTSAGVIAWARGFPVAPEFAATEKTRAAIAIAEESI
jgi:tRNA(Ile)-lysidine synthase